MATTALISLFLCTVFCTVHSADQKPATPLAATPAESSAHKPDLKASSSYGLGYGIPSPVVGYGGYGYPVAAYGGHYGSGYGGIGKYGGYGYGFAIPHYPSYGGYGYAAPVGIGYKGYPGYGGYAGYGYAAPVGIGYKGYPGHGGYAGYGGHGTYSGYPYYK